MDEKRTLTERAIIFQQDLEVIPELAWEEYNTKEYIIKQLGNDFLWSEKTALVYKVGRGPGVFFRSELDALNTKNGPKHVCGHSSHTAALMASYLYLKAHPPQNKSIYFIFQPSEESYPSGASFIQDKFLSRQHIQLGFAIHTFPSKKAGEIMDIHWASADYFEIEVEGKSTHIKNKYTTGVCDAILPISYLAQKINSTRYAHAVMNAGVMSAGETPNSIAGYGKLQGDIRALNEEDRKQAVVDLNGWIEETFRKYPGFHYKKFLNPAYPMLKNPTDIVRKLRDMLPISDGKLLSFATEDFSLYKGLTVFLLIGTGKPAELHELAYSVPQRVTKQIVDCWLKIASVFP